MPPLVCPFWCVPTACGHNQGVALSTKLSHAADPFCTSRRCPCSETARAQRVSRPARREGERHAVQENVWMSVTPPQPRPVCTRSTIHTRFQILMMEVSLSWSPPSGTAYLRWCRPRRRVPFKKSSPRSGRRTSRSFLLDCGLRLFHRTRQDDVELLLQHLDSVLGHTFRLQLLACFRST